MRSTLLAAGAAAALALALPAFANAASTCTDKTSAQRAATALHGAGTELVRTDQIAGMRTALVLEPRIHPGTRRRMVRTDAGWCDAAAGFNRAWKDKADGAATAAAFARVAAAPYFDQVTVESVTKTVAGAHLVQTHAKTNGVTARWVVATDRSGVRTATWTATDFARKPFVGQIEGLTALPGASETYTRLASGLLAEKRGLPTAASAKREADAAPSVPYVYKSPDGFNIRLSVGDARVAPDPDTSTGQTQLDTLTNFADAIERNYGEFHDWGLRKGWESDLDPALPQTGFVYVNNSVGLVCAACVFIANDFQIHMISEINAFLTALGFTGYKNERDALHLVVGHEMFHNFQNAHNNPGPLGRMAGRGASTAYSEGTARMQETLHSYSEVTYADKTLVTGGQANPPGSLLDSNHCDGHGVTDQNMADGPFNKSYHACFFWIPWFNQNGNQALVDLVMKALPANSPKANQEEGVLAIGAAAPAVPVADQLAHWAESSLTGRHKEITATSGGVTRDWRTHLQLTWTPATLAAGKAAGRSVAAGGVFGRRLDGPAKVSLTGEGAELYVVRSDALTSSVRAATERMANVKGPEAGESVWVVAVNPTVTATNVELAAE